MGKKKCCLLIVDEPGEFKLFNTVVHSGSQDNRENGESGKTRMSLGERAPDAGLTKRLKSYRSRVVSTVVVTSRNWNYLLIVEKKKHSNAHNTSSRD